MMGASAVRIGSLVVNCPTREIDRVRELIKRAGPTGILDPADIAAVVPDRAGARIVLLQEALRWLGADIVATTAK